MSAAIAHPGTTPGGVRPAGKKPFDIHSWTSLLYLLPAVAVFVCFVVYPLIRTFILSASGTDILGRQSQFVGLRNFQRVFTDPEFGKIMLNTLLFAVYTVVPTIVLSLVIALMLNKESTVNRVFRTVFALPFAYSVSAASIIFSAFFNPATGLFNAIVQKFGGQPIGWLTSSQFALPAIAMTTVWMNIGYNVLVLLAGLGSVPDEVVEAARLDGASGFRLQWFIMIPMIMSQVFFLIITDTIQSLESFGQIHVLTKGGPDSSTTTLVYDIYMHGFANNSSNFGYASAEAIVLIVVVAIITLIQFTTVGKKVDNQ
ncbi:glycerol-3-phosphate ABC transporter permease [Bifidobacterium ramosum]|uniref:ABC transporter permease subunit n=1 Tax=Bifidobacterium ramosum TaxID=1798158 RepID=A0A6L4X1J3_9BIFI|nr:sugar ABC transporter permease [Bifidobacterium ramosum]KAB8288412.1 glycerol-3-phosphate ABC transporter permease [Bifidobacterium ramosum]NEG71554.1 ABC transporter permease subunit [Bifidobacterium ramosum]